MDEDDELLERARRQLTGRDDLLSRLSLMSLENMAARSKQAEDESTRG